MVFKGYLEWDTKDRIWREDEWLFDIYRELWMARNAIEDWGNGRPFDNDREVQITRYYKRSKSAFERGEEVFQKSDPLICRSEWLRYAEFEIKERGCDI